MRQRSRTADNCFVARNSLVKVGIIAGIMIVLELIFVADPWSWFQSEWPWHRAAFVGGLGLSIAFSLRELFDDRPQIVIDGESVFCRAWADEAIAWREILDYRFERELIGDMRRVLIRLRNPDAHPPRSRWIGHKGDRVARRPGGFIIMTRRMDRSPEDLMAAMERFCPRGLAKPEKRFW